MTFPHSFWGFPHSSIGKESACNAGDPGLIPELGRSAGEGIGYPLQYSWASLVAQLVKNPPAKRETWVWSLDWEDPLEKGKATHSSILAWIIPWTVHGVTKSWTRLSDVHVRFTSFIHFTNYQQWETGHRCTHWRSFPGGSVVKNPPANAGDVGSIPRLGRSPGERNVIPLQYSCLENYTNRGVWRANVHGVAKS